MTFKIQIPSDGVIVARAYSYALASESFNPMVSRKMVMSFETLQRSIYICGNSSSSVITVDPVDGTPQLSEIQAITTNVSCSTLDISPDGDFIYVGSNNTPGTIKAFSRELRTS